MTITSFSGIDRLLELNKLLIKRSLKLGYLYLFAMSLVCIMAITIGYSTFIAQRIALGEDFYKTSLSLFIMIIFINFGVLEFRYSNHFNVSLYKIRQFPIHPLKLFILSLRIFLIDVRNLSYGCVVFPLIIGLAKSGFNMETVVIFPVLITIYFLLFESLFAILFFFRDTFASKTNKSISTFLIMLFFSIMGLNAKNLAVHIPIINLPVKFIIAAVNRNFFLEFIYMGVLLLLCLLVANVGFWLSKKTV